MVKWVSRLLHMPKDPSSDPNTHFVDQCEIIGTWYTSSYIGDNEEIPAGFSTLSSEFL